MQLLRRQIIIEAPMSICLPLWMASDYYPEIPLNNLPKPADKWSSSDAWGENHLRGNQHVEWALTGYPGAASQEIGWSKQISTKGEFVGLAGRIVFTEVGDHRTRCVIHVTCPEEVDMIRLDASVESNLKMFQLLVKETMAYPPLRQAV